ncbi:MAG TPA: hypothetical protein VM938_15225 [Acidimicrobiales bacterium]|nr:hypothetical protein [Acidimicrobiales bacterium]
MSSIDFHCCIARAVSTTDRSISAGMTVASCSLNSGVALRTIASTWPPDRVPDNQYSAVIGSSRRRRAVEAVDLAVLDVMPAWCRSQAVIDVAPSSSHSASASNADRPRHLGVEQVDQLQHLGQGVAVERNCQLFDDVPQFSNHPPIVHMFDSSIKQKPLETKGFYTPSCSDSA